MPIEQPLNIVCAGSAMLGVLHRPQTPGLRVGMLLVVGGPQYRVGSHRQFVLLARFLAAHGVAVLRFDCRGMGDSEGEPRDFEQIGNDIAAAVSALLQEQPELEGVVLWGLCDAATANAFHAVHDERVAGQVALNPWVRTVEGEAQAYIRHYYLQRLLSPELWRKVFSLRLDWSAAMGDFLRKLRLSGGSGGEDRSAHAAGPLPDRLRNAQLAFRGPTLLILSGQDLTAREYESRVDETPAWREWSRSSRVMLRRLDEADHTFSRAAWRDQVATWTLDWINKVAP
jgi:exosortase A-associated hydrolase 1